MINYLKNKFSYLWQYFTCYEKWWFSIILGLAVLIAIYFPEQDVNGVNGKIIEALYLANIFFNVLCELLIAKQSKWNFIVSLLVEATEIAIPLVLTFRGFAGFAVKWLCYDPDISREMLHKRGRAFTSYFYTLLREKPFKTFMR